MKPLLLATGNEHKYKEFLKILPETVSLSMVSPDVVFGPENEETYFRNALVKARACLPAPGQWVLADDSGLEVEVLEGRPGIMSARFAGMGASSLMNCQALVRELKGVPPEKRAARFRCVLTVLDGDSGSLVAASQGTVEGRLTKGLLGEQGFGYDPLFVPDGYQVTFGILPSEVKNRISHRARAIQHLLDALAPSGKNP